MDYFFAKSYKKHIFMLHIVIAIHVYHCKGNPKFDIKKETLIFDMSETEAPNAMRPRQAGERLTFSAGVFDIYRAINGQSLVPRQASPRS